VFEQSASGARKIIVATNIAETSLTIGGVSVVIDAGYSKVKAFDASVGIHALLLVYQASSLRPHTLVA
jgi:HrpA-like RNA helicase